jgi:hypothetical protein
MNERIRELSDIAYKNHLARNPNSSFGRRSDYDQEFAELIVRECMRVGFNAVATIDDGCYAVDVYNNIKEHFGVGE